MSKQKKGQKKELAPRDRHPLGFFWAFICTLPVTPCRSPWACLSYSNAYASALVLCLHAAVSSL